MGDFFRRQDVVSNEKWLCFADKTIFQMKMNFVLPTKRIFKRK
jgi:hypothetical protein